MHSLIPIRTIRKKELYLSDFSISGRRHRTLVVSLAKHTLKQRLVLDLAAETIPPALAKTTLFHAEID